MKMWTGRGVRVITVAGAAAVAAVVMAAPAAAAAGDTGAIGLQCAGLINCGPFAQSAFPGGPANNSVLTANVPGLLTTGVINTTATNTGATSSVADLAVTLVPVTTALAATAVNSSCTIAGDGSVSGTSSIVGGVITILGSSPITLNAAAAPNTAVTVPGVASVILNRQTTGPDGTLTVDAIYISLLPNTQLAQTITVASSSCTPTTASVAMASGKGFLVGGGVLLLLVLGYAYKRRTATS
jgi:hypothetical protein